MSFVVAELHVKGLQLTMLVCFKAVIRKGFKNEMSDCGR